MQYRFIIFFILFYSCTITAGGQSLSDTSEHYTLLARNSFNDSRFAESLRFSEKAIRADSGNIGAWIMHARSAYYLPDLEKTIRICIRGLYRFPDSDTLYNIKGSANLFLLRYDKAINDFNKAIAINPLYAQPYRNLLLVYATTMNPEQELKIMQKMLDASVDGSYVYYSRYLLQEKYCMFSKALSDLQIYNANVKNYEPFLKDCARLEVYMGKLDDAITHFNKFTSEGGKTIGFNWAEIAIMLKNKSELNGCSWGKCSYKQAMFVNSNKDVFIGNWAAYDMMQGVALYANGNIYNGTFSSSLQKNGLGCELLPNGKYNYGYFRDDVFYGKACPAENFDKYRQETLFFDSFDKNSDFQWNSNLNFRKGSISHSDTGLILKNNSSGDLYMMCLHKLPESFAVNSKLNMLAECEFTVLNAGADASIGLLLGCKPPVDVHDTNFYPLKFNLFYLSYNRAIFDENSQIYIKEMVYYNYINPLVQEKKYNIKLLQQGEKISFYVNDIFLGFNHFHLFGSYSGIYLNNRIEAVIHSFKIFTF